MQDVAAQPLPTVRFDSSQYAVVENYTDVPVTLILSEVPTQVTPVNVLIEAGTADPLDDFLSESVIVFFYPGVSDTAYAYVQIYHDLLPESPETIELTINPDEITHDVGSPGSATLTIIDNDSGTPTAHFELAEDVPLDPDGRLAVLSEHDAIIEVDVVVDDLPPGGAAISYTSSADGGIHTLIFDTDPRQTIEVPTAAIPPGEAHSVNELQILNPVGYRTTESDALANHAVALLELSPKVAYCVTCFIQYVLLALDARTCEEAAANCDFECPDKALEDTPGQAVAPARRRDGTDDIETLRRYRDEILLGSPVGAYYIQLYEDFSPDIGTAILQRSTLIYRIAEAWDLWLPAVAAEVDGLGESFIITGEMESGLLGIMAELEAAGSPELADLIGDFRIELGLETIAGTTMADLQEEIETNPMETERASWGDVKSMFR